jgi:serine/threonine protein kinase
MNAKPQQLGKYELRERLERGGMGEVWKAYDTQLRRHVAIKLLNAGLQANPNFVSLFTREAQFVASLHHPNIIQVHDFQFTGAVGSDANAYMVMDYVEGGTLADYICATSQKGQFPPATDMVYLFTAISLALDYAHQRGMIHRDIKPANILLDKRNPFGKPMGEPILTDFGIARLQGTATGTLTGMVVGTPRYLSPEQAQGSAGNELSDLYSLGIILYEMVTGTSPFQGDNQLAIMMQHIYETPPDPTTLNPNISPALSAVVLKSIAKEPEQRFPTASAMTIALAQALNVPVPASLYKPASLDAENNVNPLQPHTRLPESVRNPSLPTDTPLLTFTPPINGKTKTEAVLPFHHTPIPAGMQSPTFPVSPPLRLRRKRWASIVLIVCSILLLLGAGLGAVSLFITHIPTSATPNTAGAVVGWLSFSSSNKGTNDRLELHLQNIPAPPAGKIYYAWLDQSSNNNDNNATRIPPHWRLCNNDGTMNCSFTDIPQSRNLLAQYDWFLITTESIDSTPVIPYPDSVARRYYALLSHNGPTRFDVKACSASNASMPC